MIDIHTILDDDCEFDEFATIAIMHDTPVPDDAQINFDIATITRDAPATLTLADGRSFTITRMYAVSADEICFVAHID